MIYNAIHAIWHSAIVYWVYRIEIMGKLYGKQIRREENRPTKLRIENNRVLQYKE